MGTTISKTVNIIDLPVDTDISSEDYVIIQNDTRTFRVQVKDMILTKDNVTFGQEINDIYERVGQLQVVISAQQTQITDLQAELAKEKLQSANSLTTVNSTIELIQSKLTTLDSAITTQKALIDAETVKNNTTASNLQAAVDDIARLNGNVQDIFSRI